MPEASLLHTTLTVPAVLPGLRSARRHSSRSVFLALALCATRCASTSPPPPIGPVVVSWYSAGGSIDLVTAAVIRPDGRFEDPTSSGTLLSGCRAPSPSEHSAFARALTEPSFTGAFRAAAIPSGSQLIPPGESLSIGINGHSVVFDADHVPSWAFPALSAVEQLSNHCCAPAHRYRFLRPLHGKTSVGEHP